MTNTFQYKRNPAGGEYKYVIVSAYPYTWKKQPTVQKDVAFPASIKNCDGEVVAVFEVDNGTHKVTLEVDYAWNGSDFVTDTDECMRASALHDLWCQAMEEDIYKDNKKNWRRGAKEYRDNCIRDSMPKLEAWLRYAGIRIYGFFR